MSGYGQASPIYRPPLQHQQLQQQQRQQYYPQQQQQQQYYPHPHQQPLQQPPQQQQQQVYQHDPLRNLQHLPDPVVHCVSAVSFLLLTLVLAADVGTDVWAIIIFALNSHLDLVGASIVIMAFAGIMSGVMFVLTMKSKMMESKFSMATCLACNFPLQLGIILARLIHSATKFGAGFKETAPPKEHKDWTFAKIKLTQGTFQSVPMFIMCLYAIYVYDISHVGLYVSAITSMVSIVYGSVVHEFVRKERLGGERIGPVQGTLIFLYQTLIIVSRLVTMAMFLFYYRGWLGAIIFLHLGLMIVYFFVVYREVWKVGIDKIVMHGFYCMIAYFPLHNEYRPDGEIMIFYAVFMIENVLMISLPHGIRPRALIQVEYGPDSGFYTTVTCIVLIGSFVGLFIMGLYYFLFHRSADYIRDTHLSCCTCLDCETHDIGAKPVPRDDHFEVSAGGVPVQTRFNSVPPAYNTSMDNILAGKRQRLSTTDLTLDDAELQEPLTDSDIDRSVYSESSSTFDNRYPPQQPRSYNQNNQNNQQQPLPHRSRPKPAPRSLSSDTEHETSVSSFDSVTGKPKPRPKPAPRRQPQTNGNENRY